MNFVDGKVQEVGEHGCILPQANRMPLEVAKTEMRRQPAFANDRLDRAIEDIDETAAVFLVCVAAHRRFVDGQLATASLHKRSQLIADQNLTVDDDKVRTRVEEMCAGYENAEEMAATYMANPQIMSQIEPMVLEEQAVEWIVENGKKKSKKVGFQDYMKPPA